MHITTTTTTTIIIIIIIVMMLIIIIIILFLCLPHAQARPYLREWKAVWAQCNRGRCWIR